VVPFGAYRDAQFWNYPLQGSWFTRMGSLQAQLAVEPSKQRHHPITRPAAANVNVRIVGVANEAMAPTFQRLMVYIYQEKIAPLGPLPARTKPPDVLTLQHAIESLEQENAWLKEQLARFVRDK
jgi:hypothetical protein